MVPRNGIYIIQGELNHVVASLRRNNRWSSGPFSQEEDQDPLLISFTTLKETLQSTTNATELDVNTFLGPFLEVIRSEDTTGPITGVALSSVNKFLSYGLIDPSVESARSGIDNLADAVTHARFVGTDPSSDEVVLMKILQVLRTLLLSPVGVHMTNESVCEIMQSCFRICFEMRLSELLRRTAEQTLIDMVQLLFLRLPHFEEDFKSIASAPHIRKMFKRSGSLASSRRSSKKSKRTNATSKMEMSIENVKDAPNEINDLDIDKVGDKLEEALQVSHSDAEQPSEKELDIPQQSINIEKMEVLQLPHSDAEQSTEKEDDIPQQSLSIEKVDIQLSHSDSEQPSQKEDDIPPQSSDDMLINHASIGFVDPEKMKSISEDLNIIGVEGDGDDDSSKVITELKKDELDDETSNVDKGECGEPASSSNFVAEQGTPLPVGQDEGVLTDVETKSYLSDEAASLENFSDHGVISLHYPEEDGKSINHFEHVEPIPMMSSESVNIGGESITVESDETNTDYINQQGVRFMVQEPVKEGETPLVPYGLPCVRELLRFLTTLINPHDRHNTNTMIHIGLSLLTVALESGATHIGHFSSLMQLVRDDTCKNIFSLLQCDIHILFALSMRVNFLLFEALRGSLKFQLERFIFKLMEILSLDNLNVPYEKREMALEYINQMFHIPCLIQELYLNFDCELHNSNALEDLCKTLSKNASKPGNLSSVNLLALDALLTIVTEIETHCHATNSNALTVVGERGERTVSVSSENTIEDESGVEELEEDLSHTALSTSGYALGKRFLNMGLSGINKKLVEANKVLPASSVQNINLRSPEDIINQKRMKNFLMSGIEEFNKKPKLGIESFQNSGLLSNPFDAVELVNLVKENVSFDKKTVGDYIGERKNMKVLEAFVASFDMVNLRIDEALRNFLESFRLPGESPVIAHILEEFTKKYFEGNPFPYKNSDAAFTLAYAVIMLNVDQHNKNVKQQKSMTIEEFKKNLRQINGGEDFPAELLEEIFENIRTNEIVMPSERHGKVKEAYEWKVLMKKCNGHDNLYIHVDSSIYDKELFLFVWGPTLAALSYVYENSAEKSHIQKAMQGFKKCSSIAAYYNLAEVFDDLFTSLCKFTGLMIKEYPSENLSVLFGGNVKSQLSIRTAFSLAHKQGDIIRDGWQNLLICIRQLLKAKLLPTSLTEVDDFVDQSGKVSLIKEEPLPTPKQDNSGVLAAFYSYMIANPDTSSRSVLSAEERESHDVAVNCIKECRPENIITESKFLRSESLHELTKCLIIASKPEHSYESTDTPYDEDSAVFFLEFIIKIALQNRDRILLLWPSLREHLSNIIISAPKVSFLVERAVVGLLRLSIRLIQRDEISGQVLITLRILLMMHPVVLMSCSKEISYGLHELIRTNATNIHYSHDWITILTLIQVVGAGASPPIVKPGPCLTLISGDLYSGISQEEKVDLETGETYSTDQVDISSKDEPVAEMKIGEQWLLINKNEDEGIPVNQYDLKFKEKLNKHDRKVFIKASSSITFIVREMAHVREFNIFQCIYAVLLFGEASSNGGLIYKIEDDCVPKVEQERRPSDKRVKGKNKRVASPDLNSKRGVSKEITDGDDDSLDDDNNRYNAISLQLLDLMYDLHLNASKVLGSMNWEEFSEKQREEVKARWSSKESIDQLPSTFRGDFDHEMSLLWVKCWCPLMQGIARFCCDTRKEIRMAAQTVLQRALLAEDLQTLSATEWENCFNQVLFPMLSSLLEIVSADPLGLEESRMRGATLLCKAFLQHLNTLISLSTFTALWMTILDFMDKYMNADNSDLLYEAIPESLKNMLLVMSTAGIFECPSDDPSNSDSKCRQYSALWQVTWERIDCFLPNLKSDLIATRSPISMRAVIPPEPEAPGVMTIHNQDEISYCSTEETSEGVSNIADSNKEVIVPVSSDETVNNAPESTTIEPPPEMPETVSSVTSEPTLSPLLSKDPPSLNNVQLTVPLPHLSPPGSVIPIHENTKTHPIPVVLPPMQSLTLGQEMLPPQGQEMLPPKEMLPPSTNDNKDSNDKKESDASSVVEETKDEGTAEKIAVYDI